MTELWSDPESRTEPHTWLGKCVSIAACVVLLVATIFVVMA